MRAIRSRGAPIALMVILLLAAAVRLRVASVPLERDEGEYAYAGQLILKGIPPYALAYNMKFPGTYYAYAAILALFGESPSGIHVGLLLVNAATIVFVWLLGRTLLSDFAGVVAAAAFAVLSLDRWTLGIFAHATHFVLLPAVAAFWVLLRRGSASHRTRDRLAAGALLGIALLMKQHGAAFLLMGAVLAARLEPDTAEIPVRSRPAATYLFRSIATLLLGAAIPIVLLAIVLAVHGLIGRFWFWTIRYASEYATELPLSAAGQLLLRGWSSILVATMPIWWLAAIGFVTVVFQPIPRRTRVFLIGLSMASLLAIVPGFYFRQHYFILLLPAASLLVAAALDSWRKTLAAAGGLSLVASGTAAAFVLLGALAAYVVREHDYLFWMPPATLSRQLYGDNPFVEAAAVGRYIAAHTLPDDRIAVFGSEPEIYFYAHRKSATGYIYTYPLMEQQPFAGRMQDEMIKEIQAARPAFVVFVRIHTSWLPMRTDSALLRWGTRYLARCYERAALPDIGDEITTYRRVNDGPCSASDDDHGR